MCVVISSFTVQLVLLIVRYLSENRKMQTEEMHHNNKRNINLERFFIHNNIYLKTEQKHNIPYITFCDTHSRLT